MKILIIFLNTISTAPTVIRNITSIAINTTATLPPLHKNCPHSEFFWSAFSRFRTEYGETIRISPYSVRIQKNADQNNSEHGQFTRSTLLFLLSKL